MKCNLTIKYHYHTNEYIDGRYHFKQLKATRKVDSLCFYDTCIFCKNSKNFFRVPYDGIEQITDGNTLIIFKPSDYKYQFLKIRILIEHLCNFTEKVGDK